MHPPQNEEDLYLRVAKKFAIDFPNEKDRVIALKWLKLIESSSEQNTKNHVIKLLLICLQRKLLVGPFSNLPEVGKKLTEYSWSYQPADITRLILKSEFDKIGQKEFFYDLAGDLCEYVAVQEIPQFGSQFYYAFSPESIRNWSGIDAGIIPRSVLEVTTVESPEKSILATSVEQSSQRKERHSQLEEYHPLVEEKTFAGVSMIDASKGSFREDFIKERPQSREIRTDLLESIIQDGIVKPGELEIESRVMSRIAKPISRRQIKPPGIRLGQQTPGKLTAPHVETVQVQSTQAGGQMRKVKAPSKLQRRKAWQTVHDIELDPDEVQKRKVEARATAREEHRVELMQMIPERSIGRYAEPQEYDANLSRIPSASKLPQPGRSRLRPPTKSVLSRSRLEESWQEKSNASRSKLSPATNLPLSKRVVFKSSDKAIVPEEVEFEKFVQSGGRDTALEQDANFEILQENLPDIRSSFTELQRAEQLLEDTLGRDNLLTGQEPNREEFLYKEVMMEGSRTKLGGKSGEPQEGGVRVGKRIMQLPGRPPVEENFLEQFGNIDDSLEALRLQALQESPDERKSSSPVKQHSTSGTIYDQLEKSMQLLDSKAPMEDSRRRESLSKNFEHVTGRTPNATTFESRADGSLPKPRPGPYRYDFKTRKIDYSPIGFDFKDDIGPPPTPQSPQLVSFREAAPGYFVPETSADRLQFAERQRNIVDYKFPAASVASPAYQSPRTPQQVPVRRRKGVVFPPSPLLRQYAPTPPQYDYSHVSPSPQRPVGRPVRSFRYSSSAAGPSGRNLSRGSQSRERGGAREAFEDDSEKTDSYVDDVEKTSGAKRPIGRKSPIKLPRDLTDTDFERYGNYPSSSESK